MRIREPARRADLPQPGDAQNPALPSDDPLALCRKLLWLYFFLLLGEGALRKWAFQSLSAPLLIIRDPVVLLLYFQALKRGIFPRGEMIDFFKILAGAGAFLALLQYAMADPKSQPPVFVLVYGWRTNFLFFPLIFLIPRIFDEKDVVKMGRWCLIASIPMALLMAYQFNSSADAYINRVAGLGEGKQLDSALGRIRPSGTFSFITGPVCFYSLVAAFFCQGITRRKAYPLPLLVGAILSTGLAVAVSGSRSCLIGVVVVVVALVAGLLVSGQLAAGTVKFIAYTALALFILGSSNVFKEGREVLMTRWSMAQNDEEAEGGLAGRFLDQLFVPFQFIGSIPVVGAGLGVGTNVGAVLLTGEMSFLLSEGEWGRNLLEMGPLFGLVYIGFRVALCAWILRLCLRRARRGRLLSLLLFCATAIDLLNGQIGQPTTLGFTVLVSGLCLAASAREEEDSLFEEKPRDPRRGSRRFGGRGATRGSLANPAPDRNAI